MPVNNGHGGLFCVAVLPLNFRLREAVVVAAAMLLSGCVPQQEDRVTIRASFWGGVQQSVIEQRIVDSFEAAHPEIRVQIINSGGRYAEKIQAMMIGGIEPDVIMVDLLVYHNWAARGVLDDLTSFIDALEKEDPFMPLSLETFSWQGRYYAVPTNVHGLVTYFNRDVLAGSKIAPPDENWTWADLEKLGPALSRHGGNSAAPTDYACALPPPFFFMIGYGVKFFDDAHLPTRVTVADAPAAADAIDYWRRMHRNGWAVPRNTVLDQGESEMFRDGRIAFTFSGRYVTPILAMNPGLNWDIAPFPESPSGRVAPHGGTGLAISKRTRNREAAQAFVRHYVSTAGSKIAVTGGRMVPVRRSSAYGDDFLALSPPAAMRRYSETMEPGMSFSGGYMPGLLEINELVHRRLEQALAEPELPAAEIVEGLAGDLRRWHERTKKKGVL